MPKFTKDAKELETRFDKWMYILRNLNKLERIPEQLRENVFERLFEVAEIARFSADEVKAYEDSLKSYRDLKNSLDTAYAEGIEKGMEKGIEKVAINGIRQGKSDEVIMEITGLNLDQLAFLKDKLRKDGGG